MITGTFNKIPKKKNSHGYGWARTWSENLDVGINHEGNIVDVLYLDHGVNFGGSLNLFGGFTEDLEKRINNFLESRLVYSLDIDMPDYGAMLKKRKDVLDKDWCDKVSEKCSTARTLKSTDISDLHWLTIGDSHTAAYSKEGSMVIKTDGLTLNGQIKTNFEYVMKHILECMPRGITMSFGNIDIRHHLCRLNADSMPMLKEWKKFGEELERKGIQVEYSTPWPIEFEERKLPKTGYYKDKPFWGSQEERINALNQWISNMDELGMKRVEYPEEWLTMNSEAYAQGHMESTSSVHLSPESYRRKNWGINCVQLTDFML